MKRLKHELVQFSALLKERSAAMGFVFVDDTDLTIGNLHPTTSDVDDIIEEMQKAIDVWEGCLKTTGGAMRPEKSFACVLSHVFNSKG